MTITDKCVLVCGIMLIALLLLLAVFTANVTCHKKATMLDLQSDVNFWEGCIVKKDGSWIPIENAKF